jgi:hypothetical protein
MNINIKAIATIGTALLVFIAGTIVWNFFIGENDVQNFQVIQSPGGAVRIQSQGGWYLKTFDKVWTYPKTDSSFFSNVKAESKDGDGVVVRFKNKGGGTVSCNVITRYFTDDVTMKKLHEYCGGDLKKLDNILLARIKEHAANEAAKIDSSAAIESRETFANNIRTKLDNDVELKERGIIIESFAITSIDFDVITDKLFEAQRNADLQKRSAEAEEANLIMQKKKTEAQAAQKIAEVKGMADAEKMKAVTDAERQAELARIEAEKRVAVEKLAKEEAIVKAQKTLELAEITQKEEAVKLETIKIQAEQKIAEAKAKQQQIQLSGAITEEMKYRLDIEMQTKIGVAQAIAEGIKTVKLPETMIVGGGDTGKAVNSVETFFQLMNVKQAKELRK